MQEAPKLEQDKKALLDAHKRAAQWVYILIGMGFATLITPVIGVLVAYYRRHHLRELSQHGRDDNRDTAAELARLLSHFDWQITTFWIALAWLGLGVFAYVSINSSLYAWLVWLSLAIWTIYRLVRGWLHLSDDEQA